MHAARVDAHKSCSQLYLAFSPSSVVPFQPAFVDRVERARGCLSGVRTHWFDYQTPCVHQPYQQCSLSPSCTLFNLQSGVVYERLSAIIDHLFFLKEPAEEKPCGRNGPRPLFLPGPVVMKAPALTSPSSSCPCPLRHLLYNRQYDGLKPAVAYAPAWGWVTLDL